MSNNGKKFPSITGYGLRSIGILLIALLVCVFASSNGYRPMGLAVMLLAIVGVIVDGLRVGKTTRQSILSRPGKESGKKD